MSDVLGEILQTERKAEEMVKEAGEAQRKRLQGAVEEADRRLQKARAESQKRAAEEIERARQDAEDRYQAAVREAEARSREGSDGESEQLSQIIDDIIEIIVEPEFERDDRK